MCVVLTFASARSHLEVKLERITLILFVLFYSCKRVDCERAWCPSKSRYETKHNVNFMLCKLYIM